MKNGKNLTRNEKVYISTFRLQPANWLISKKTSKNWLLVHRNTGTVKMIPAP